MTAPPGPQPFGAAGYRGEAVPEALDEVLRTLLPDPARVARTGEALRVSRYRVTARVALPSLGDTLLKCHLVVKRREAWLSLVRPSRAREEWEAARWLQLRGLPVAPALAVGERRHGRRLAAAFFLARFLSDVQTLRDAVEQASPARRRALAEAVGRLVRTMHDAAFDHRDLHAGNVLVHAGEGTSLTLADLHRHRRGPVSRRRRAEALGRLIHSLEDVLTDADLEGAVAAYCEPDEGGDAAEVARRDLLAASRRTARSLERTRRRSRARRCLLESTVYTREVGPGVGARRRDLPLTRIDRAIADHDAALRAADGGVAKIGRKSRITRHGDLVVKEAVPLGLAGRVKDAIAPRRHAAGYRNAHLLDVLGVETARPQAWIRRNGRVFTLYEDLSRLPRLDLYACDQYASDDRPTQVALRDAVADWLAALHAAGIYHGDLKGVNVLVRCADPDGTLSFPLIDTDRVLFFDHPVDHRRLVKNLAQLAASIPVSVTRTERLRFFRRYARGLPFHLDERRVAREARAALERKILVRDEPIE